MLAKTAWTCFSFTQNILIGSNSYLEYCEKFSKKNLKKKRIQNTFSKKVSCRIKPKKNLHKINTFFFLNKVLPLGAFFLIPFSRPSCVYGESGYNLADKYQENAIISQKLEKMEFTQNFSKSQKKLAFVEIKNFDPPMFEKASELLREMDHHVSRPIKDALILLLATVFVVPLMRKFNTSPILGFLAAGLLLGPNGFGLVHRIGASKTLAEFGVVFFFI